MVSLKHVLVTFIIGYVLVALLILFKSSSISITFKKVGIENVFFNQITIHDKNDDELPLLQDDFGDTIKEQVGISNVSSLLTNSSGLVLDSWSHVC